MNLVIFGTGKVSSSIMKYPVQKEHRILAVVDNDEKKWGSPFFGHDVQSPSILSKLAYDRIILAVNRGYDDIRQQLLGMGVQPQQIVGGYNWRMAEYMPDALDGFFAIPKKPLIPFKKAPVKVAEEVTGRTGQETRKAHARRVREGFFEKYCQGEGLDIGCGDDPVTPQCSGWDFCNGDAQYLQGVPDESFDFVYSSHCIEHMVDVRIAIANWFRVVRHGGCLIIYGPERDLYEKRKQLPSRFNPDHKHFFLVCRKEAPDTLDICEEIREALATTGGHYRIEYIKVCHEGWEPLTPDVQSPGEYAFEIVIRKM